MKFKAHQSFFIRKGWLGKGMRAVERDEYVFVDLDGRHAMDELGLGANMVKALRYWMQACGLTAEPSHGRRYQRLTDVGRVIRERDPYVEEFGALWAVHVNLASQVGLATSWHHFFNRFPMRTFTQADFVASLGRRVAAESDKEYSLKSFEDDFSCILSTYMSHEALTGRPSSPESLIDCPLGELGLVEVDGRARRTFRKSAPSAGSLPREAVAYAVLNMLAARGVEPSGAEVPIEELLGGELSPGRLMNLDAQGLLSALYELEDCGFARVVRTAGLDVVRLCAEPGTPAAQLGKYYDRLG